MLGFDTASLQERLGQSQEQISYLKSELEDLSFNKNILTYSIGNLFKMAGYFGGAELEETTFNLFDEIELGLYFVEPSALKK